MSQGKEVTIKLQRQKLFQMVVSWQTKHQQLSVNIKAPCENMTERNPYNEAQHHADTSEMGRARRQILEEKHVLTRSFSP